MGGISCSIRHDKFFDNVDQIAEKGYGLELIGIAVGSYQKLSDWQNKNIDKINKTINKYNVPLNYHGYFYDVDIGLSDQYMREYSLNSLLHELDFCSNVGAGECIIHNAYKPGIVDAYYDFWMANFKKSLDILINKAEKLKIKICMENFWDKDIEWSKGVLSEFDSKYFGLCVDIGHINVFGNKDFKVWLEELKNRIIVFHLTDNSGSADEHLALGEGNIDYIEFFELYKKNQLESRINIETYNEVIPFDKSISWIKKNTDFIV